MEAREELKKLRESTGMNRKEFCEYFEIPYMTETDWELGNRRVPQYLLRLMAYKIYDSCQGEKDLYIVSGATHKECYRTNPEKYEKIVSEFIEKNLP